MLDPADLFDALVHEVSLTLSPAQRRALSGQRPDSSTPLALDGPLGERLSDLFREVDTWHADALAERLGVEPPDLLRELSRLELAGLLERISGGEYALRPAPGPPT